MNSLIKWLRSIIKTRHYYQSLDFLPVWNYYKALELDDLRYLLRLNNYESLPDVHTDKLEPVMEDINFAIQDLENNLSQLNQSIFDDKVSITKLQLKYYQVQTLIGLLMMNKDEDNIKKLAGLGYRIDHKKDYLKELTKIKSKSQSLITLIKIEENKLNSKLGIDPKKKDNQESAKEGKKDIYSEVESMDSHRPGKSGIDIHTMSMRQFLTIRHKIIKEIQSKKDK